MSPPFDTSERPTPTCPHCGHAMNIEEMGYGKPTCAEDLFALAPSEDAAVIECPVCDKHYWVRGGYTPHYTSALSEDEL